MVRLIAHYDGKVLVPEQPVELPTGVPLDVVVEPKSTTAGQNGIRAFDGLGKEIWEGVDPVQYQRTEREGWR